MEQTSLYSPLSLKTLVLPFAEAMAAELPVIVTPGVPNCLNDCSSPSRAGG